MSEPVPIRDGLRFELDVERELFDYAAMKIIDFKNDYGTSPEAIAIVLVGKQVDGTAASVAGSWSPEKKRSRFETCALASTLLTKRAIRDDL